MGKLHVELIGTVCKYECRIEINPNVNRGNIGRYLQSERTCCVVLFGFGLGFFQRIKGILTAKAEIWHKCCN